MTPTSEVLPPPASAISLAVPVDPGLDEGPTLPAIWNARLAPYKNSSVFRSLFQLVTCATLFAGVWWAMLVALRLAPWAMLPLSLLGGGMLVRLFIILHDCAHGSFFRSRVANDLLGGVLGVVTLTPYAFWRRHHVLHHATSGNLDRRGYGDVDTLTVTEYRALTKGGRLRYRLMRNPLVFLLIGPPYLFLIKHRLPIGMSLSWKKEWRSVLWNNLAVAAVVVLMAQTVGLGAFLWAHAPIFLVSSVAGIWLFYVQHQFADTYWRRSKDWDFTTACLSGSSYVDLPRPLRWLTGSIEVHHIHHLCSSIPNYRLRSCMAGVKELPAPRRLSIWQSFRCARLALWDEANQRLVSFRDLDRAPSTTPST